LVLRVEGPAILGEAALKLFLGGGEELELLVPSCF
jgi:hypothetical protein